MSTEADLTTTTSTPAIATTGGGATPTPKPVKPKTFHGSVQIKASTAKKQMVQVVEEIINLLQSDPNTTTKISVEIAADFPDGANDQIKRGVSENANSLGFQISEWE